jgi:hypothetical protein
VIQRIQQRRLQQQDEHGERHAKTKHPVTGEPARALRSTDTGVSRPATKTAA